LIGQEEIEASKLLLKRLNDGFGCRHMERHIEIVNRRLENVEHFVYLGSVLT